MDESFGGRYAGELNQEYINSVVNSHNSDNFGTIQQEVCASIGGRSLSRVEKGYIDTALYRLRMDRAECNRAADSLWCTPTNMQELEPSNILMVTAYSNDYSIGGLCEKLNRKYASISGYRFMSDILALADMSDVIYPKKHCTWYKIALIKRLLSDTEYLAQNKVHYIMWIDADAIVADYTVLLTDVIARAGGKDLIIAEDMNTGCLINAGVFLLRTTHWSKQFIEDVWNCTRYDDVTFYEQSAMIRSLRAQKEGLDNISPFHSYLPGAVQGIKHFPHVAVLPIAELNTNRGLLCNDVYEFEAFECSVLSSVGSPVSNIENLDAQNKDNSADHAAVEPVVPTDVVSTCKVATTVKSLCYRRDGNFCPLCRRTVGIRHHPHQQRSAAPAAHDPAASSGAVTCAVTACSASSTDKNTSTLPAEASPLFIFHPAGMPEKLKMLHTAIYKYRIDCNLLEGELRGTNSGSAANTSMATSTTSTMEGAGTLPPVEVATGPLRLVRGKMGQIPQAHQTHLFSKLHKTT